VRTILDRIDDPKTGKVVDTFQVKVPEKRIAQIEEAAKLLGHKVYNHFPFVKTAKPMADVTDPVKGAAELMLNRTWKANMSITGAEGLPLIKDAGNVLRSETSIRISLRIPPTLDPVKAKEDLEKIIKSDPPYGANIEIMLLSAGPGLHSPEFTPELEKTVKDASISFYGNDPIYYGEGGSIPFLSSLYKQFPKAQFLITGVLGPESNAHGANEMLEMAYTKKLICCLSYILADFYKQK
jgi:acetylornithine deacetylase/succinyl-diaminopimelate desuccinylase-like protein